MNYRRPNGRPPVGRLIGAVLGLGLGLLFGGFHVGESWLRLSYDPLFGFRSALPPSEAVIVYLDDNSYLELHHSFFQPWDRDYHARLLERLRAGGAKAVVFDIVLSNPGPSASADEHLAQAMRAQGKVFLAALGLPASAPGIRGDKLDRPFPLLREAAAGWGLANLDCDLDRVNRRFYPGTEEIPALAWVVAEALGARATQPPASRWAERWFNYYGPPLIIPSVSYVRALATNELADFFRDKVVFIGGRPTASSKDVKLEEYPNPYTRQTRTFCPGVEVHATAFLNLYRGDWIERCHPWLEAACLALLGAGFGYGLTRFHPLAAAGVAVAGAGVVFLSALALCWSARLLFPWWIVVAVQLPAAFTWCVVYHTVRLHVEKRLLEESLVLHLSPSRVRQILKQPDLLKPGAEEQEVSILFTDIASFSRVTGRMASADLFQLLNNYYEVSLGCVHELDGTVINLIGDAIFAVWNAPFPQPDPQERACRAALRLCERLVHFEADRHSLPLRTRVGLHTGLAHVGNVGSSRRFQYTAVGDNVNLASRLEGLNKHLGTAILATRDLQRVVEKSILSRMVGHFRFKGLDRVVEVHEILGAAAPGSLPPPWREPFADALFHFQRKDFDQAEALWRRVLELKPKDGPSLFYLDRIAEFRTLPPAPEWAGEIDLKEK